MRVLFVEDHPAMVEGYKTLFTRTAIGTDWQFDQAYTLQSAYEKIMHPGKNYDLICLDIEMQPFEEAKLRNGEDLARIIRKQFMNVRLLIMTSHMESSFVYPIIKAVQPEGYLVKSDVYPSEIIEAVDAVMSGKTYYSKTIQSVLVSMTKQARYLDANNRQIILLLNQGIKTKNIPSYLNLSLSAVDKRKSLIKEYFGIEKGNDEDILREARKCGFI